MGNTLSFETWMKDVDFWVSETAGVSVHDLADIAFRDLWEDNVHARKAAKAALENEGWDFS